MPSKVKVTSASLLVSLLVVYLDVIAMGFFFCFFFLLNQPQADSEKDLKQAPQDRLITTVYMK